MGILEDKTSTLADLVRSITNTDDSVAWWTTGLDTVQALRMIRETADSALRNAVDMARDEGESWDTIGAALGTTRQAAWERYGKDQTRS